MATLVFKTPFFSGIKNWRIIHSERERIITALQTEFPHMEVIAAPNRFSSVVKGAGSFASDRLTIENDIIDLLRRFCIKGRIRFVWTYDREI